MSKTHLLSTVPILPNSCSLPLLSLPISVDMTVDLPIPVQSLFSSGDVVRDLEPQKYVESIHGRKSYLGLFRRELCGGEGREKVSSTFLLLLSSARERREEEGWKLTIRRKNQAPIRKRVEVTASSLDRSIVDVGGDKGGGREEEEEEVLSSFARGGGSRSKREKEKEF